MPSNFCLPAGAVLVIMGIAGLSGSLATPTWLAVWNLVIGSVTVLYGASRRPKGD